MVEGVHTMKKIKDIKQKMDRFVDFDGIALAVWGTKSEDNKEKFAVNFAIDMNSIFDLLSFTEYDYEKENYNLNDSDIFIINTLYDCIMNFSNMTVEYISENAINIYVPIEESFAKLEIRSIEYESITIVSYERVESNKGVKPGKIGIYNFDTMEYENFPEDFIIGESRYYVYG